MRYFIIDTDIGDDIDDVLAIALAAKLKDINLVGVTTVHEDTIHRAKIAKSLLKSCGMEDIPVIAGISKPLMAEELSYGIPNQYCEDFNCEIDTSVNALEFIKQKAEEYHGELEIIAIGPLTNIALAITVYPELINKIKCVHIMGGCFDINITEYNIQEDVEAAKIVFRSGVNIQAVGIDITKDSVLSDEQVKLLQSVNTPFGRVVSKCIDLYIRSHSDWLVYLHDPLAVFMAMNSPYMDMRYADISVETQGEITRGQTYDNVRAQWWMDSDRITTTKVCCHVDQEKLKNQFIDLLTK